MKEGDLQKFLIRVHHLHRKSSSNEFSKLGITQGQPRILNFLVEHDGCNQKDLSDTFDLEPATITKSLELMEKSELVKREIDQIDRRNMRVFLTPKGKFAQEKVEETLITLEQESFEGFSDEEKEKLIGFLKRIYDNLKKSY